jgi:hypothetical protein
MKTGGSSLRGRRTIATHLLCVAFGAILSAVVVSQTLEQRYWNRWQVANRERKGYIAEMAARTLARLRTGAHDDAIAFLEDRLDHYVVGVPMGDEYPELSHDCQHALAVCKVYRSRFAFPDEHGLSERDLHVKYVPMLLEDVPLLAANHEWLDEPMRRVRRMPARETAHETR